MPKIKRSKGTWRNMAIPLTDEEHNLLQEYCTVYSLHRGDMIGNLIRGKLKEYREYKAERMKNI